jgi:heptosyltransferase-2
VSARSLPRTVLLRLPNPLGDVVMAMPLLALLRAALPGARILAAGADACGPLLEGQPGLDGFLPMPRAARHGRGAIGRQATILRAAAADAVLILPNSWSSALAAWRAGVPQRVGRRGGGRGLLLTASLAPITGPAPMTELYADLLPLLGLPRPPAGALPPARLAVTRAPPAPLDSGGRWLGVAPGAAFGPSKLYPDAALARAVTLVASQHGLRAAWIGAPDERPRLERLAAAARAQGGGDGVIVTGDLGAAKIAIAACAALLAMDNGARHVAAALGVPQAVIYGPTHPAWSAHALEHTVILRREDLPCLACHLKRCPLAGHPCMNGLAPEQVADAIGRALKLAPRPA